MKKHDLELTSAEALVLFEWLARNDRAEMFRFEDEAEQNVVWNIEAQLEKELVEPLSREYDQYLAAARREVRGGG